MHFEIFVPISDPTTLRMCSFKSMRIDAIWTLFSKDLNYGSTQKQSQNKVSTQNKQDAHQPHYHTSINLKEIHVKTVIIRRNRKAHSGGRNW